jgi:peptidoglycan hydrolase-like protein with peptidoglycan-binding domain
MQQTNQLNKLTLQLGSRNAEVKELQQHLKKYYWLIGSQIGRVLPTLDNGVFDFETQIVVKAFQYQFFLEEDGIVGSYTWRTIYAGKPVDMPILQRGSRGEAVKKVQLALLNLGYYPRAIDGEFGSQTSEAVRTFQKDKKLSTDAIVGEKTWFALSQQNRKPQGGNYNQLRDLLAAGLWKEADEVTARLMFKAIGLERDYFENGEISKIPCSDLSAIDKLWVQASNGRFGFSVQKRIWESVGGSLDTDDTKVAERFGDRIGQYMKGDWVSYDNLTFNAIAPAGHLPALWWRRAWVRTGFARPVSSMAQRLVSCNIT